MIPIKAGKSIDYLQYGNARQQQVHEVLVRHRVMEKLAVFDPILAGTIPIQIDIETSDLDIICCFSDPMEFQDVVGQHFGGKEGFTILEKVGFDTPTWVARFAFEEFDWEIFGQAIPTQEQYAYRHMLIEYQLLQIHGEDFRQRIVALKRQGLKTEPAFAKVLNLDGDPYQALLQFENR